MLANCIRFLAIDAVEKAKSGHPGMPMGMADIATVLFRDFLKFDPNKPNWLDRDRFVLSNGHGSMLLYACLYLLGYKGISIKNIKNFRQLNSPTPGHPEYNEMFGIETTTGPLAQGLGNAVGMALAERILNERFGDKVFNHNTYVFAGDGCLMEGLSHEVCSFAGHINLSKLIVFFDDNSISIDGSTDLSVSDNHLKRFQSYGWHTLSINGHNQKEIYQAIKIAKEKNKPSLIACKTKIGFGSPNKENKSSSHGSPLGEDEINLTRKRLGWSYPPFKIPSKLLSEWRSFSLRNKKIKANWEKNFNKIKNTKKFNHYFSNNNKNLILKIEKLKKIHLKEKTNCATRKSSQIALETITSVKENLIGGSADLTGSNNTKTDNLNIIKKNNFKGRYIHYGVREHAMASIMNGLSLHKGLKPYGGTFLVFTDYCRPSIRLAALMELPVIYVMSHDSIGLGEDGPTHQPVEHLASLRSMPNINVIRPCDIIETIESWEYALNESKSPTVLVLTRQNIPTLRSKHYKKNLVKEGAYIIKNFKKYHATLFASGSEVEIAINTSEELEKENIHIRVVSFPSWELFLKQSKKYQKKILGNKARFAIEAGVINGWEKFVNEDNFLGMSNFGASGQYKHLYEHYGLNKKNLANLIKNKL